MPMTKSTKTPLRIRETIPATKIQDAIKSMAHYVSEKIANRNEEVALVGVQTRGVVIANRVAEILRQEKNIEVSVGAIDITLYRDDVATSGIQSIVGETHLDFGVDDKKIFLIDDVLFTGRTVRAALDELMDFGRPKSVSLIVLVDRGHRELPIETEFAPIKMATKKSEAVNILLNETDGKEEIVVGEPINQ